MRVLLLNGSPNAKGCTYTALDEVARTLNACGAETEIVQVGGKNLRGCIGCRKCAERGQCVFDDLVNETAPLLDACDGLVVGSPVYFSSANGELVAFLDRLFYSTFHIEKTMKVGAAVVSARRAGTTAAFDVLNKYFTISGMPVASSQYWNMVHGNTPDEVRQDAEGLRILRVLGRNMAFLMRSVALGRQTYGLPEQEERVFTNFIR
jgi:multimeric flavodoxin WrbA